MSTHARRVATLLRHREQVARLIAVATVPDIERLHCSACSGTGIDDAEADGDGWCSECEGWYENSDEDGCCLNCGTDLTGGPPCEFCAGSGTGLGVAVRALLGGGRFDVALAREYGERLVADGDRNEANWVAFSDWTRALGKGPESIPSGGWPWALAREWSCGPGRMKCDGCGGTGTRELSFSDMLATRADADSRVAERKAEGWTVHEWTPAETRSSGGGHWWAVCGSRMAPCATCQSRGMVEGPQPKPGAAMVRMGKRLLAALEGHPSECPRGCRWVEAGDALVEWVAEHYTGDAAEYARQFGVLRMHHADDDGRPSVFRRGLGLVRPCLDCRGTGHNLYGALPAIDWMKQHALRRKLEDMPVPHPPEGPADWIMSLIELGGEALRAAREAPLTTVAGPSPQTRVGPRGEHSESGDIKSLQGRLAALDRDPHRREWRRSAPEWVPFTTLERIAEPHIRALSELTPIEVVADRVDQIRAQLRADGDRVRRSLAPAWRRGENRHAEHRTRTRERRVVWNLVDAQASAWGLQRRPGETDESLDQRLHAYVRELVEGATWVGSAEAGSIATMRVRS